MKWGAKIMFGMLIASVLFSTVILGKNLWTQEKEQKKFEDLSNKISAAKKKSDFEAEVRKSEDKEIESMIGEDKAVLSEYQEIVEENPDFAGWISIEGTHIDYPVMQTSWEPEYYLHRNFAGEYSYAGVPFVGTGDLKAENGWVFIYAHNMRNGTMFADLLKYEQEDFWRTHPVIQLDTLWEHCQYEIFSVLYAKEDDWEAEPDALFSLADVKNMSEQKAYCQKLKRYGIYETGIIPDGSTPLLFLVTCCYQINNGRFVVIGMRINK